MNFYFNPAQPDDPFHIVSFALFREWTNLTCGTWNAEMIEDVIDAYHQMADDIAMRDMEDDIARFQMLDE